MQSVKFTPGPWEIDEDGEVTGREGAINIGRISGIDDFPCFDPETDEEEQQASEEYDANRAIVKDVPHMFELLQRAQNLTLFFRDAILHGEHGWADIRRVMTSTPERTALDDSFDLLNDLQPFIENYTKEITE